MTPADLDRPGAIYWMLLTLMALEPEEQVSHLLLPIPSRGNADASRPTRNPLLALNLALDEYKFYWFDEHERTEALAAFDEARELYAVTPGGDVGIFCIEEFLNGERWRRLRELARRALEESRLGAFPLPQTINFDELVELVDA